MKIKKFALLSTIVAGSLLLGACGGGDSNGDDAEDTVEVGDDHSFIYVTNDPIGVNEFLESGKVGIEQAAEEFNGTSKIYESDGTDESRRSNLDAAVAEAPDVVVMITFDFTDLSAEYAEANPDQEFLLIDDCPADAPDNLTCAVFREHEARSEEHTSELQSRGHLVCRLLLEKKKKNSNSSPERNQRRKDHKHHHLQQRVSETEDANKRETEQQEERNDTRREERGQAMAMCKR